MTKLMIVIHSLRGGGSERVLVNLLKGLNKNDFSITLVLYEREFDFPVPKGIDVRILDIQASKNIFKLSIGFFLKIMNLTRLIRKEKPDTLFSLLSSTNATVILATLLSGHRCRMIVSEHTHPSLNLKNEKYGKITKYFIKHLYPKANRVIAVSEGIKKDLIENFHFAEEKITVIYNPFDIHEIEMLALENVYHPWFDDELPVIVSVGRLTKQKGYPYLIGAFSIVMKSLPCKLLIIGEGEDRERLVQLVKERGLEKNVEFIGFQRNPFNYMARSTLFVMSSLYEGFGNVIVEAMALGLPVISTDCSSGPAEIIENRKNGMLVPVEDEGALVKAMLEVLTDEELKISLSREAKVRANSFAIDNIIKDYRSIFREDPSSAL